jgi:prepilin-type N-terminal cleavage/methylation domain-containing protein
MPILIYKAKEMNNKGLSLVEMLVALVISSIIVGGIYTLFVSQSKIYSKQEQVVEVQQNIRVAMNIMVRDLQMVGYDDDTTLMVTPSNPIVLSADSATIQYEKTGGVYQVRYWLNGTALQRDDLFNNVAASEVLLENVDGLRFTPNVGTDGKVLGVQVMLVARTAGPDQNILTPRSCVTNVSFRNILLSL